MVAVDASAVGELVRSVALVTLPTLELVAALHAGRVATWVGRRAPGGRARHRRSVSAAGPPLEQIAADLHRIGGLIAALPVGAPYARRQGAILAYDDVLGAACRALGVDDELGGLPFGPDRDVARVRVEAELVRAGLVLDASRAA